MPTSDDAIFLGGCKHQRQEDLKTSITQMLPISLNSEGAEVYRPCDIYQNLK
jgi:hypothetical protein